MLLQITPFTNSAQVISGAAHIVVSIDAAGKASLCSFFQGRHDATYAALPDERLLHRELPKLLDELRAQVWALTGSEEQGAWYGQ